MADNTNEKVNNTPEGEGTSQDDVKNIKAEFSRKWSNYDEKLAQVQQANQQILEQLQQFTKPKEPVKQPDTENLSDLMYSDPDKYAQLIEARATAKAEAKINARLEARDIATARQNEVFSQIVSDYPEVGVPNHPLAQKTAEIHKKLSADERANPTSYRLAVLEAAAEMGVVPKSKRTDPDDGFVMEGGGSGGAPRQKKQDVNDLTLQFAAQMGYDVTDPKVVERFGKHSKRNWSKYQ